MGIGRREFLKFAAIATSGVVLRPFERVCLSGDYYVNERLGLGFTKPAGWFLEAFRDFEPPLRGQILQGISKEAAAEFIRHEAPTLLATITKTPLGVEHDARFSPGITIFKNTEDLEELRGGTLDAFVTESIEGFGYLLKNYEVLEAPTSLEISRCPSRRFKARFLFEHEKIPSVVIEDETLVIDQGTALYTIHCYDSLAIGETATTEFCLFRGSLHLA